MLGIAACIHVQNIDTLDDHAHQIRIIDQCICEAVTIHEVSTTLSWWPCTIIGGNCIGCLAWLS